MLPYTKKRLIPALCAVAAAVACIGAATPAQAATPTAADWTSIQSNIASGTVAGTSVSLSGTQVWNTPTSRTDGSWPYFSGPAFSPGLAMSDVIQIGGAPGASYTLRFGATVTDPVLHLGSVGSRIEFVDARVARVSGETDFTTPTATSVSGKASNTIGSSGNSDASGTIKLVGNYSSVTFRPTPNYTGPTDGILVQVMASAAQSPTPPPPPPTDPNQCANANTTITQANLAQAEQAIICLTNLERRKRGLRELTVNSTLRSTALAHSNDMLANRYFRHRNLQNLEPCERIRNAGYPVPCIYSAKYGKIVCWTGRCGENLSYDPYATPNRMMYDPQNGWMTHMGEEDGTLATNYHRAAILEPGFREIGVGLVADNPFRTGGATATVNFGSQS